MKTFYYDKTKTLDAIRQAVNKLDEVSFNNEYLIKKGQEDIQKAYKILREIPLIEGYSWFIKKGRLDLKIKEGGE